MPLGYVGLKETAIGFHLDVAAYHLCWISRGDRTWRDILGHHAPGPDHTIVADSDARQNNAFAADEAVPADMRMHVESAGAIMRQDAGVESDISVFADVHALWKGHVRLGAKGHFNRGMDVHFHEINKYTPTQPRQGLAQRSQSAQTEFHDVVRVSSFKALFMVVAAKQGNKLGSATPVKARNLKRAGLACVAVAVLAALALWPEIPAWRSGGTRALGMASLGSSAAENLCPSAGDVIELRGDSLVAGSRMGAPAGTTGHAYPQVMQDLFAFPVQVIALGMGGFTAPMAEQHWRNTPPQGNIVMLAFGTNDAAPRGWLTDKQPVPVTSFMAALTRQLARLRSQGVRLALIAPAPTGSQAMNERLAPYRQAVAAVGKATGTPVLDPAEAIAGCEDNQPLLVRDALHLNQAGHQCIGTWLASAICKA